MVIIAVGFMVQDVVADALTVELARTEEEIKQIQTLGRMALLAGTISVGYLSGWLAGALGPRPVFAIALLLPALVMAAAWLIPRETPRAVAPGEEANPLGAGKSRLVVLVGLGYAALGVALEALSVPFGQEIILVVSGVLIVMLLQRVGISRAVADRRLRHLLLPGRAVHRGRGSATGRSTGSASIRSSWACSPRSARC